MSAFRCVDGASAGPEALGILIPPGRRTLVLLRPRALAYDLVPLRPRASNGQGVGFDELSWEQAAAAAPQLLRALDAAWNPAGLATVVATEGGFVVEVRIGERSLLACRRIPGEMYRPAVFGVRCEAEDLAAQLDDLLCPPAGVTREVYFNTRHFNR